MKKYSYAQIFGRFWQFGCLAWGGPLAQIAMLKHDLVDTEQWISHKQFNRALAVFQALPGPEAHELCVYFGMVARGRLGGLLAGLGFMLPGLLLMLGAIALYATYYTNATVQSILFCTQAAVLALIIRAVYKISQHVLYKQWLYATAALSFVLMALKLPFIFILLGTAAFYIFVEKRMYLFSLLNIGLLVLATALQINSNNADKNKIEAINAQTHTNNENKTYQPQPITAQNLFNTFMIGLKGGLLTFGGAYTAIPFIENDAVNKHQWLSHRQFLDGLAIANILPAPLVIFATFSGYFGASWWGALLITLGIFLPSFAATLIGFHTLEKLINYQPLHLFLDAIAAAVVGIIAFTALQMAYNTLHTPLQIAICALSLGMLHTIRSRFASILVISIAVLFGLGRLYFIN